MNVRTIEIDPREIKLLELNARYMKHEEFKRLVDNVRRDGQLTSAPFLCLESDGRYRCLSGNHRTRAAIEAGLEKIVCIATDDPLTEDQKIAVQLSHNAISGQDDPATLKELYGKILDVEMKKYSGLDDKTLELLDKFSSVSISEANLSFQTLSIVFLPDELKAAQAVLKEALACVKGSDETWLARFGEYDAWLDAQETASSAYNVKNVATAMGLILSVFARNAGQLSDGWAEDQSNTRFVPIESVIGRAKIPIESAKPIRAAIDRMVGRGEVPKDKMWQVLQKLAEDYLKGEKS